MTSLPLLQPTFWRVVFIISKTSYMFNSFCKSEKIYFAVRFQTELQSR